MAAAVSEHQQNNVQSSESNKAAQGQIMHNGTENKSGNAKPSGGLEGNARLFAMNQYMSEGCGEGSGGHGGSSPKESTDAGGPKSAGGGGGPQEQLPPGLGDEQGLPLRGPLPLHTGHGHPQVGYPGQKMLPRPGGPPHPHPGCMFPQQQQQQQQQQPPQSQQRFLSGQSISQPSGPTPTLNQLLQTSNTIQRMQNSYGGPPGSGSDAMYAQNWQHHQPPPGVQHPHYSHQPGAASPNPSSYASPSSPFVHRPPQSSTPNTNLPETVDLAGQNSNDSFTGGVGTSTSGGGAPGTPNSQGMRPSPSPTGSTGSRSMSPAVGQQNIQMPPRPSSSQSDGSGPTRMSHSPMATQGGYQGPPPPPHIAGYKIPGGVSGQAAGSGGPPGAPPYSGPQHPVGPPQSHSQFQASTQSNYGSVRAQGNMQYSPNQVYGSPNNPGQSNPNANNMGSAQYSGRPMPNHFPGYQPQTWNAQGGMNQGAPPLSPNIGGKGSAPVSQSSGGPSSAPSSSALLHGANAQSPRPSHYLKQHLQHKMGFGGGANLNVVTSHSPPQGYPGMGPPNTGMHHHPGATMGPPSIGHMGHNMTMGPPNMAAPNSHDGPMPPPSSTPNSHVSMPISIGSSGAGDGPSADSVDNGITTTAASNVGTHVTPAGNTVTSVVTTGPDGTSLDEGSQQSTLSNASIASGEDPQCSTPKSRKNDLGGTGGHYSHPATPQSTVPSPGAASMNSMHADEFDISSPSWPRTPASPVFNSHVPQAETYRSKKSDSLGKLYEMDDSPDRRSWLDKLLGFMEERRTPITTCPTISKNPLDLFRLYLFVKERGGFMEVTKNKTWKDIAGMLGIGASSSAAYTLRKHYTKNLLAFECKFDRGGIDPQPIINQVEATSKKKGAKSASIPSPGSSNSQDSFPTPGSSGASMDGYGGYGYSGGQQPDYNSPSMQRPSSQSNAPSPHPSGNVLNHQQSGNAAGDNISVSNPFDDGASGQPPRYGSGAPPVQPPGSHQPYVPGGSPRPQGMPQAYAGQSGYNQYSASGTSPDPYQNYQNNSTYPQTTRSITYPQYSPDAERGGYASAGNMNTSISSSNSNTVGSSSGVAGDPYSRYNMNASGGPGGNYPPRQGYGMPATPSTSQPSGQPQPAAYTGQPDYYRNEAANFPGGAPGQTSPVSGGQVYGNGKAMPPPSSQPRRHPDFAKDQQQYQNYNQQKPQMYGWPNSQYRGQYGGQPQGVPGGQGGQWPQGSIPPRGAPPPPAGASVTTSSAAGPWGPEHRYPPGSQPAAGVAGGYQQQQPGQPQWNTMVPNPGVVGPNSGMRASMGARPPFRAEGKPPFNMPPPQVLKSSAPGGMATSSYTQQPLPKREITFPPDSVEATMPMLYRRKRLTRVDVAPLDAWRIMMCLRSGLLSESTWALDVLNVLLFDDTAVAYFGLAHLPGLLDILLEHFQRSLADMFDMADVSEPDRPWFQLPKIKVEDVDLGAVATPIDASDHSVLLSNTPNYSMQTRKGAPVRIVPKDDEIFIMDNLKEWDVDGDQAGKNVTAQINMDPWQLTNMGTEEASSTKHILTCFQAEFGHVPFVRLLRNNDGLSPMEELEADNDKSEILADDTTDDRHKRKKSKLSSNSATCSSDIIDNKNIGDNLVKEIQNNNDSIGADKYNKKRTKTLSDVLTRIKQEVNDTAETEASTKEEDGEDEDTTTREEKIVKTEPEVDEAAAAEVTVEVAATMAADVEGTMGEDEQSDSSSNSAGTKPKVEEALAEGSSEVDDGKNKLNIRDPAGTLKRRRITDYEDESYSRDEASLCLVTETQESLGRRCICISNILRNLTFVPGNEIEVAKNASFLGLLGKLLLLHHEHPARTQKTRNYDREEDADFADSCSSLQGETEWWWDFLVQVRENVLVASANIAGYMDLGQYPEVISRPILDGLLHWAICPSAHGQDPFVSAGPFSMLSPQRLALESLCKLCVTDSNVDLVIATPPYSRLERLCSVLTKLLCRSEEQVLREFAVNLLHYLAAASSEMSRTVALQSPCVSLLVAFIEQAEQSALGIANQHGIGALRENPDAMGTSLDMLRRAAHTLLHLARHPDNRPLFIQQEQRLLSLVMSQILDQQVASIIARVLYQCSQNLVDSLAAPCS